MGNVLYGMPFSLWVFEIERTEVNSIKGTVVHAMKGEPNKTAPLHIFATDIQFNSAVSKIQTLQPHHAISRLAIQMNIFIFIMHMPVVGMPLAGIPDFG